MSRSGGRRQPTATRAFGAGSRESHDASAFYSRFSPPTLSTDDDVKPPFELDEPLVLGDARDMAAVPDNSVALVVTSPPYFAGKDYEKDLDRQRRARHLRRVPRRCCADVFAECVRVLEPGGRIAVNVANLGRKPYRSPVGRRDPHPAGRARAAPAGRDHLAEGRGRRRQLRVGIVPAATNPVLRDITERVDRRLARAASTGPSTGRAAGRAACRTVDHRRDEFMRRHPRPVGAPHRERPAGRPPRSVPGRAAASA